MEVKRFFATEPTINWEKIYCPVCGNPTGPTSTCYDEVPSNMPKHKRKIVTRENGIMPIYSRGCVFRQDDYWAASINYPVSKPLLSRLSKIEGVEKILPAKAYTFHIAVGHTFDAATIRKKVNYVYKSFIKEMQSKELGTNEYPQNIKNYTGIKFPNGKVVSLENASKEMQSILDNIPGTTGITERN
jgi:hypothetical protein